MLSDLNQTPCTLHLFDGVLSVFHSLEHRNNHIVHFPSQFMSAGSGVSHSEMNDGGEVCRYGMEGS